LSKTVEPACLVPVGKVTRTHGIRGALKIFPYGESLAAQAAGERFFLRSKNGGYCTVTLIGLRVQGRVLVCGFEEIKDVDGAQPFVGEEIFLPEERLPPVSEGEYYHYRLIGLDIVTLDGESLGVLRKIIETGGNDVYVAEREGREILIPAIEDVIREIDLERKRMVVDLPEGLVDA